MSSVTSGPGKMKDSDDLLTLGEAISRMRAAEDPTGEVTAGMSAQTAAAFDMHDAVHILFDCGTSIREEIAAHAWMKFGTTVQLREMHRALAQQEHRKVLSGVGHLKLVGIWLTMLPRIASIYLRTRNMQKPIVYERLEALKSQRIKEIRSEHGIPIR